MAKHLHKVPTKKVLLDEEDDTQGCFVPLSVGGPWTKVWRASEVDEFGGGWVWKGRVPAGHLTSIVGPKGAGKSLLIAEIAARLSTGEPWPDDPLTDRKRAETLIITGEDDIHSVIVPRLRACGADLENVHIVDFRREDGTPGEITVEVIEKMTENMGGLKLIVIDPIADLLGEMNDRRRGELRTFLHKLARYASEVGVAIILVNANDKVSAGKTRQYGVDVVPFLHAATRAVWTMEEDPSEPGRCLWLPVRSNVGARRSGLAFRMVGEPGKVVWDPEPVELKADDLQPVHRRVSKVARAGDWLRGYLEEGARTALEVHRDAALEGLTRGALHEAKSRLGVLSVKETDTPNAGWKWYLPEWCEREKEPVSPQDSKILAKLAEALRLSCRVEEIASRGEIPDAGLVARQDVVSAAPNIEQPPESPEDSKNSKVREASAGGEDGAEIERATVAREGGSPQFNAVVSKGEYGEFPEDSNCLAELVGVP